MRIIGGNLRGRRILAPSGDETRPMLDRVREAMFSTLHHWLPDARVLDLFAGSGSLGLEALSRGASSVRCIESSPHALDRLRDNVATLELAEQAEIVPADALDPLRWGEPADIVFLDPPYALLGQPATRAEVLGALGALVEGGLAEDGIVVLHAPTGALADEELAIGRVAERRYGTSALWYVQAAAGDDA